MITIDLNADLGEGTGNDAALIGTVSSASIACGGHAGDLETMHRCIEMARRKRVAIGAHPGFPDRTNFGRVRLNWPADRIAFETVAQVGRLLAVAAEQDARVSYVKLHGALNNMCAEDEELARTIFAAIRKLDDSLAILAVEGSAQVTAAESLGLQVVAEAFADRGYVRKGILVPRSDDGAILSRRKDVLDRCLRLAEKGEIVAHDGSVFESAARSICLHGDTPGAVSLAQEIRDTLAKNGVSVANAFVEC